MQDQKKDLTWKTLSSEYVYQADWFTARKDTCIRQDGTVINNYFVFEFPEWATALAITKDGKIILEKQYRHALGEVCIELPGGCIDATDSNTEAGIRRELLEETGYRFDKFEWLGKVSANPSTNSNLMNMFLATGGEKVAKQELDLNEEIDIILVTPQELVSMIQENKLMQSMHLSTILYAFQRLGWIQYNGLPAIDDTQQSS
jgi:8-oxo-dGTP pyrophosphatase MutT (NUDIX family)